MEKLKVTEDRSKRVDLGYRFRRRGGKNWNNVFKLLFKKLELE